MSIKKLRQQTGMTQKEFGEYLNIPHRTIQNWEGGKRNPPPYVVDLIKYKLRKERKMNMLKLILKEEGQEKTLIEGTIVELIRYLEKNYDNLFSWIESDHNSQLPDDLEKIELPEFDEVETLRDLEGELDKVDMDWWKLTVKEV